MNGVLDFLLDGLEKWLELERELGVRSVEVDRNLLTDVFHPTTPQPPTTNHQPTTNNHQPLPPPNPQPPTTNQQPPTTNLSHPPPPTPQPTTNNHQPPTSPIPHPPTNNQQPPTTNLSHPPPPAPAPQPPTTNHQPPTTFSFIFLHDRPLEAQGLEMMAKLIPAMGKTPETAPVVIEPPLPSAKIYIVMGARALRKFFPLVKGEPGQWLRTPDGKTVLVTYSPTFLFRFGTATPALRKMKEDMWRSLKAVMQRVR